MVTLRQQVEQARGILGQYVTNRPILATFTGWQGTAPYTGINLAGLPGNTKLVNAVVELGHELVHVSSHDPQTNTTLCPPWFRQQQGSPANDAYAPNSVAVVNPQWPYWHIAQSVVNGVENLYPSLFAVKTIQVASKVLTERYLLPDDVDEIVSIKLEDNIGPVRPQRTIARWSLDTLAADSKRYLHIEQVDRAGYPIYVTYRAKPVVPDPTGNADWSTTGLPASAADLPVLWAVTLMLPSADAAKVQTMSVEQSERNRFVQPNSANSTSKRFENLYQMRLNEEKKKLVDRFPPRVHRTMN